ncbi:MAG: phosphatidylserine/phosphatidylglycerophosphate/cardiolipin synthase family protein [Armatimonadetes bacterium]|nr:phosphatidylserine/phosphatidylglycerophosphate/cardiolipin synthase family protein [Armatimonadota bacterium]
MNTIVPFAGQAMMGAPPQATSSDPIAPQPADRYDEGDRAERLFYSPAIFKRASDDQVLSNPVVGQAGPTPSYSAGTLRSPRFLPDEESYFREARRLIESARAGDMLCLQMYEFQNEATDGDRGAAKKAPGYPDQQALLPGLAAAGRGVKVNVVLDASRGNYGERNNTAIVEYLNRVNENGNITVDYYPPGAVNLDHVKMLLHFTPDNQDGFQIQEALVGGTNWGNHTPANDDGGGAFYGRDAIGAADVFFRDQAFCRGDNASSPDPRNAEGAPVEWAVTAPVAEGGGSMAIKEAKMALTAEADEVYINQYVLTNRDLIGEIRKKGKGAHVRVCPTMRTVNSRGLTDVRRSNGQALWANTKMDPERFPAQKAHQKLDIYVKDRVPFALTFGSANDTANGLEVFTGMNAMARRANHEMDAIVHRVATAEVTPEGNYSTAPFLDAALAKTKDDLKNRSSRFSR